jgi:hypothetical protein
VPELKRACTLGQCIVCGTWFSLDSADEPLVDVSAEMIIQSREADRRPWTTASEESGLAGTQRWYGTTGWDAGWLASAHEHHDAILRDEEPAKPDIEVAVEVGSEPEDGVEVEVSLLPDGSHDRIDCPCDHPPGEAGPCAGCNCGDGDYPDALVIPDDAPEAEAGIEPYPDTLAAPPRSWPPNTGTPDAAIPGGEP